MVLQAPAGGPVVAANRWAIRSDACPWSSGHCQAANDQLSGRDEALVRRLPKFSLAWARALSSVRSTSWAIFNFNRSSGGATAAGWPVSSRYRRALLLGFYFPVA